MTLSPPRCSDAVPLLGEACKDPFHLHRLALVAVTDNLSGTPRVGALENAVAASGAEFAEFLLHHGLASLWHHQLSQRVAAGAIAPEVMNTLRQQRFAEAALYLTQKSRLSELDDLFNAKSITYAVIKGAHVRELAYRDPALRPACDIDILVAPEQREAAARALMGAGFRLHANAEIISYEATFTRGPVAIDLHWDILRPGRTRIDVTRSFLSRRQRTGDFWGLEDSDAIFLMLVHPAFAKYVCSPNMGLNRVADFVLWLHGRPVDWNAVADRLENTGLKTAAWTVLQWFRMLFEPDRMPVPKTFIDRIHPGALRARYLAYWLRNDLPGRWLSKPLLIKLGFTLALHDRPSDAARAIRGLIRARRAQNNDPLLRLNV
jgi:hypothetical protein